MWPDVRKPQLKMAQPSKTGEMWGPIIEKAWAKVKGSYTNADGGLIENGLRALTGAPVYIFETKANKVEADIKSLFDMIKKAEMLSYIMTAGTDGLSDTQINHCGIDMGHAYSILTYFTLKESSGKTHDMLLVRNPWGISKYSWHWHFNDKRWNKDLLKQVPMGIDITDPAESDMKGYFVMPMEGLL